MCAVEGNCSTFQFHCSQGPRGSSSETTYQDATSINTLLINRALLPLPAEPFISLPPEQVESLSRQIVVDFTKPALVERRAGYRFWLLGCQKAVHLNGLWRHWSESGSSLCPALLSPAVGFTWFITPLCTTFHTAEPPPSPFLLGILSK